MTGITNPIALAALAGARNTRPNRPKYESSTADKIVIRASDQLLRAMAELGKSQGRSANSEVILAVVESLAGRVRARASRKIYETYLGPELATAVINQVIVFDKSGIRGTSKSLIRLPDGIRVSIAECIDRKTSIEPRLQSMNSWVLDALVWWINYQRETHALLDACIAMDSEGQLA